MNCNDCPRGCNVDRTTARGFCGEGYLARVAKVVKGFAYEEPCLGKTVDAVFFSGCNLRCSYCQNIAISRGGAGREYGNGELGALFDGMDNAVDLVTPTHFLSAIERAANGCKRAHKYIYNTSGYETADGVRRAASFCAVFLTDYKYADEALAARYSSAPDYPKTALRAITEMKKLSPDVWEENDGVKTLKTGVVIRHLVLPGQVENTLRALDAVARECGTDTLISLMSQFTPNGIGEPTARLKKLEYKLAAEHALSLGFKNGFFQEFDSASPSFIPDFGD